MEIYLLFGAIALVSYAVSAMLKQKFVKYSQLTLGSGLSGKEVAEQMLADNGIRNVSVRSVSGYLSDHYNPANRTVNLSPEVYNGHSVASAAVAAHECGHALQHAVAYPWLKMRSQLVPVVSISSRFTQWILLAGVITVSSFPALLIFGIALFALTTLFSFITLPVEINASRRATVWLEKRGITDARTAPAARDALKWAAMTYVVAALSSLATLVYYIMIFLNSRRRIN
ncbi:MAG: zinc metallopeptidase [Prevotellaceae bacterium]|jgi:Zn-dependent membrane protease YugP|nr:zinc metallopeptidase [Prevotellaceae bacterium]